MLKLCIIKILCAFKTSHLTEHFVVYMVVKVWPCVYVRRNQLPFIECIWKPHWLVWLRGVCTWPPTWLMPSTSQWTTEDFVELNAARYREEVGGLYLCIFLSLIMPRIWLMRVCDFHRKFVPCCSFWVLLKCTCQVEFIPFQQKIYVITISQSLLLNLKVKECLLIALCVFTWLPLRPAFCLPTVLSNSHPPVETVG